MSLKNYRGDLPYQDDYLMPGKLVYLDELHKIYYEQRGEGPHVLLIPGLTGDAGEFASLINHLMKEFTVITYDRRGYSRSPRGWSKSSLDEQVNDIAGFLDALKINSIRLISTSVGSSLALKFWFRFPKKVLGGILHEPWIPSLLEKKEIIFELLQQGEKEIQKKRIKRNTGLYEARLRYLFGYSVFENLPTDVRKRLFKNHEMYSIENLYFNDWFPPSHFLLISNPSSIILTVGRETHTFLKDISENLSEKLGVKILQTPGGHGVHLDHAEEYASLIKPLLMLRPQNGGTYDKKL
jgi:pimeloyl-ACP methyl ester carboxylesterase